MAALARWPNADPSVSSVQQVTSINEDGDQLIEKAQNVLEQGEQLQPTKLNANVTEIKDYGISIVLKNQFNRRNNSSLVTINVNCKDYAGEFFGDLIYKQNDQILEDYLEDCLQASGLLLLVDGLSYTNDQNYAMGLDKFLTQLDRSQIGTTKRRIAFVMTKCEQSELWINLDQPQITAQQRFPQMINKLKAWEQMGSGNMDCFMTSAFGMLGNARPEPNMTKIRRDRDGLQESVIKKPKQWKPFGLVAPIYWLCTGQRHKQLDQE